MRIDLDFIINDLGEGDDVGNDRRFRQGLKRRCPARPYLRSLAESLPWGVTLPPFLRSGAFVSLEEPRLAMSDFIAKFLSFCSSCF